MDKTVRGPGVATGWPGLAGEAGGAPYLLPQRGPGTDSEGFHFCSTWKLRSRTQEEAMETLMLLPVRSSEKALEAS